VLEMAGLQQRTRTLTRELAGGWKQRLALGCAILHEPELLFLDEPTAGVDPISRRAFWELLYSLAEHGATIFVTTHYMDEAERCQSLAFILDGQMVAEGSPQEIKHTKMHGQVLEINCADARTAFTLLREMGGFDEVALYGARLHVVVPDAAVAEPIIRARLTAAHLHITAIEEVRPSLEDVFIAQVRVRVEPDGTVVKV